jgi:hypothetical protein
VAALAFVAAAGDHLAVHDQHGPDRHLASGCCIPCLVEGKRHETVVVTV